MATLLGPENAIMLKKRRLAPPFMTTTTPIIALASKRNQMEKLRRRKVRVIEGDLDGASRVGEGFIRLPRYAYIRRQEASESPNHWSRVKFNNRDK